MRHEIAAEKLLERAYGELSEREARALDLHLQGCEECRAEAERLGGTIALMRTLGPEPEPPGAEILLAAARQQVERARAPGRWMQRWLPVAVAASMVLVVAGVSWKILQPERPPEMPFATSPSPRPAAADRAEPAERAESKAAAGAPAPAAPARARAPKALQDSAPPAPPLAAAAPAARPAAPAPAPVQPSGDVPALGLLGPPSQKAATRAADEPAAQPPPAAAGAQPWTEVDGRSSGAAGGALPAAEARLARRQEAERVAEAAAEVALAEALAKEEAQPRGSASRAAAKRQVLTPAAAPRADADADRAPPSADALLGELRRMRDAGELNEAKRRPEPCAGGDTERLAWFDGWGKARRFARTAPLPGGQGEVTRDQYYDEAGRLRLALIEGTGPAGRFARRILFDPTGRRVLEDPATAGPWPAADLTLHDPSAAFWGPQRCGR